MTAEDLTNLKQPMNRWMAAALENLSSLLGEGEDPSFTIEPGRGVVLELRVISIPGCFERFSIPVNPENLVNPVQKDPA